MAKTPSETKSAAAEKAAGNTETQTVIVMAKPVTKTEEKKLEKLMNAAPMQIKRVVF